MRVVTHQAESQRFIIELPKDAAILVYKMLTADCVDFTHTYVPFRARGQGHAEALVEAGLLWAKQQGYKIQASCWYVDKFLKDA